MKNLNLIKATGVDYKGALDNITKSKEYLQPLFEAFTNSLESIKILKGNNLTDKNITIKINYLEKLLNNEFNEIQSIEVIDDGIGFNKEQFTRFVNLNDNSKGYSNNGTGRVQFLHFFEKTVYESVYNDKDSDTGFSQKIFTISKNYINHGHNAIINIDSENTTEQSNSYTRLRFEKFLNDKDKKHYEKLTLEELKKRIIEHYLDFFCENRTNLPNISIKRYAGDTLKEELNIISEDIPQLDKKETIEVSYSKFSNNGKKIEKIDDKKETFTLKSFLIPQDKLQENIIYLVSKHEVIKDKKLKLQILQSKDIIDEKRYLFLLSGTYIDQKDGDNRGNIAISTKDDFKKMMKNNSTGNLDLYQEVLLDDIEEAANDKIVTMYSSISQKVQERKQEIEDLKDMFLLNDKTMKSITINLQDTEETVLKKVYKADAEIVAQMDIKIREQKERINALDTTSKEKYSEELNKEVLNLVKLIPMQNRMALTHYVARRKIVLDLFQKILDNELNKQSEKRNIDEKLLHNLIFQQSSDNPDESDLWVINEDFIYFKGTSDKQLKEIKIDGESLLRDEKDLSAQELEYKNSLSEDRYAKKPDVLLFPDEGKCIILEFKNPDVNISSQLQQINNYASLIWNFSKDKFKFNTFYGYFIGEKINTFDVRAHDSSFIESYHFDFLFRPSKPVAGLFGRGDANLYMEVIKYSTLLERAKRRNEIFIQKLVGKNG